MTGTHSISDAVEIRVERVGKSFRDTPVLDGVDFEVARGEIVAIVGGSGCGKTVLLEHLIGQMSPDAGRVLVANHDEPEAPLCDLDRLSHDEMDRIRIHWAVVFQRNALFSGTVFENIALWLREIRRLDDREILPIAVDALRAVGFDDDDGLLDRDRDELSGGMAKRVAVARALVMDPTIIFYDEPTTGLDPLHAGRIHRLVDATHRAAPPGGALRTTVVITHDKDLLRRLRPRVLMLHRGRVSFDGSYEAFADAPSPIIRPYFDLMPALHLRTHPG